MTVPPPSRASALFIWPHTPTIPKIKEKPAQNGVRRQPSWAQLGGKDEVANKLGGCEAGMGDSGQWASALGSWGGQRGKKGGATMS